jgi:hypothetical protein
MHGCQKRQPCIFLLSVKIPATQPGLDRFYERGLNIQGRTGSVGICMMWGSVERTVDSTVPT